MMQNAFYFTFLFLRYLIFCPASFGHAGKWFEKKLRLILKFMTSQIGKQIITNILLINLSRCKSNQMIKFYHL